MEINENKTEVMHIGKGEEHAMKITINGKLLKRKNQFRYLGSVISRNAKCTNDIKQRIAQAKAQFTKRRELLSREIKLETRKRILKTMNWSLALYAAET